MFSLRVIAEAEIVENDDTADVIVALEDDEIMDF